MEKNNLPVALELVPIYICISMTPNIIIDYAKTFNLDADEFLNTIYNSYLKIVDNTLNNNDKKMLGDLLTVTLESKNKIYIELLLTKLQTLKDNLNSNSKELQK